MAAAGLVDPGSALAYEGPPVDAYLTLGVTEDDRVALLDEDDQPILWL